jgi:signal peptidase I
MLDPSASEAAPEDAAPADAAPTDAPPADARLADVAPVAVASRRSRRAGLLEIVETLVLTVVIFLGIQAFIAQPYKVEQLSMENTLQPEQFVLVDKLTPRWAAYERGDIVVFNPPETWANAGRVPFIKRLIGMPGDRVEIRDGKVLVNDVTIDEPYLFAENGRAEPTEPSPDGAVTWLVPQGDLFVMGDHRQASADSRAYGTIAVSDVIGRAWLRYWPLDTFGVLPSPTYPDLPAP